MSIYWALDRFVSRHTLMQAFVNTSPQLLSATARSRLGVRLMLLLSLLMISFSLRAAPVSLEQSWQYRWGDSPFSATGVPLWTQESGGPDWHAIDFPSNPPDRQSRTNVWYRTVLPDGDWRDPVLYIYSVDLIVEVYLDGQRIYHYGEFDQEGKGHFQGWPWHMITLPEDAAGKPIYFRIYSDYLDIGLWGEVKIMERMALYDQVSEQSVENLIITVFCLLVTLLAALFALIGAERRLFLAVALFSAASAGLSLSGSPFKQIILNAALFWEYISAGSYYLLPLAMAMLLSETFKPQRHRFLQALQWFFLAFVTAALGLSLSGWVNLSDTYPVFDAFFAILVPLMLAMMVRKLRPHNLEERVILAACGLFTLLLLLDMAVAHSWIEWRHIPVDWGALVFVLAVISLSLRHYIGTQHSLTRLNTTLEAQVRERTRKLQQLADLESARARALEFGNQKSRLLDQLTGQIEAQADVESALTLLEQGLAEFCAPVPGVCYRREGQEERYRMSEHWGNSAQSLPVQAINSVILPHPGWHSFNLSYQHPHAGQQVAAIICINLGSDTIDFEEPQVYTLTTLFTRAVERMGLALSRIALQEALSRLSYEDALTGLHNRRYLDEMLPREFLLAQRNQTPLTLMICDIDHFKRLNDTHGHAAGDVVLKEVGKQLRDTFRQTDIISRYGGEEFVVVMPGADLDNCQRRSEQLREQLSKLDIMYEGKSLGPVTLSAGICSLSADTATPEQLLQQADNALYAAKHQGRNRVICASV